jgi:hypothetical protein
MHRDIWVEGREISIHSAVLIFFDKGSNRFLLEERPLNNQTLGGEVVFPSEKGAGLDILGTAKRGVKEELGKNLRIKEFTPLPVFSGQVGDMGEGKIQAYIVSEWEGDIENVEPEKGKHVWVGRNEVMGKLTYQPSKYLFLFALISLGLIKRSDFIDAPRITICK